jgi:hypothetical protein
MMLFLENRSLRQSGSASGFSGLSADLRSSNFVVSHHLHLRYQEASSGLSIAESAFRIKLREISPAVSG